MITFKISRDINGNKVCKVSQSNKLGFSIQTNGNLTKTDKNGVCDATAGEVREYVEKYGTKRQKAIIAKGGNVPQV